MVSWKIRNPPTWRLFYLTKDHFLGNIFRHFAGGNVRKMVALFDIGNVLLKFDDRRGNRQLMKLAGKHVYHGCLQVFKDEVWRAYGLGQITDDEFYAHVRYLFAMGKKVRDAEIEQAVADVFTPVEFMIRLLHELKGHGLTVIALTNGEPPRVRWHENRGFRALFNHYVVSCEVGLAKPDQRIYMHALSLAGAKPEEAFFIDDLQENVEAAAALGIAAHQFTPLAPRRLGSFLEECGHSYLRVYSRE